MYWMHVVSPILQQIQKMTSFLSGLVVETHRLSISTTVFEQLDNHLRKGRIQFDESNCNRTRQLNEGKSGSKMN